MGLQKNIVTIENYNYYEAPVIFQADAGAIMMARKKAEASATSPAKADVNGAINLGVWAGFIPEITLVETKDGNRIDIFNHNGHQVTYEELIDHLDRPETDPEKWYTPNLILIRWDENGVDPSAGSLVEALIAVKRMYGDPNARRKTLFDGLRNEALVDIERSQARADAFLWQQMIDARKAREALLSSSQLSLKDIATLMAFEERFDFVQIPDPANPDHKESAQEGTPGVFGFADTSQKLRAKGRLALNSIEFHSSNTENGSGPQGDVFAFIFDHILKNTGGSLEPLKERLQQLASRGARLSANDRILANFEAIALMGQFAEVLAWQILKNHAADPLNAKMDGYLSREDVRQYLSRYLYHHGRPLKSDSNDIRVYAVDQDGERWVVAIDRGAVTAHGQTQPTVSTAFYATRDHFQRRCDEDMVFSVEDMIPCRRIPSSRRTAR